MQRVNTLDPISELKKNLRSHSGEVDLINLNNDLNNTQRNQCVDKEKQIVDYQMKMLEEFLSTTSNTNSIKNETLTPEQQKEFQKFFDEYENQSKPANELTDVNKFGSMTKDIYSAFNFNTNHNFERAKILIPEAGKENMEENVKVNEDLIDEVLLEKNLEKNRQCRANYVHISKTKTVETDRNSEKSYIMDQIIMNNDINFAAIKLDDKYFHSPIVKDKKIMNNNLLLKTEENLKSQLHLTRNVNELVTKHNIKYLEPIQVEEKLFQKRSVLKSDVEKLHLTPGPSLEEKSIVLPQIMKRLQERNKMLERPGNTKQKLILDSGSSYYRNEDQTKQVTTKLSTNPSFYEPKANNLSAGSICQNPTFYASTSRYRNLENPMATKNVTQKLVTESNELKNNEIGRANNQNSSRFTPIEKIKAIKREQDLSQGSSDFELWMNPRVLRPPEPLLEDCNKSRYVNYVASAIFRDFVNGK